MTILPFRLPEEMWNQIRKEMLAGFRLWTEQEMYWRLPLLWMAWVICPDFLLYLSGLAYALHRGRHKNYLRALIVTVFSQTLFWLFPVPFFLLPVFLPFYTFEPALSQPLGARIEYFFLRWPFFGALGLPTTIIYLVFPGSYPLIQWSFLLLPNKNPENSPDYVRDVPYRSTTFPSDPSELIEYVLDKMVVRK